MAGLWNLSYQQFNDLNGKPLIGARVYFYEAGTITPLTVYQDYNLAITHPTYVESDGFGILPGVFLDEAFPFYRSRMTTSGGEEIFDIDGIPVIGPVGGGGGGGGPAVDPYALSETGDVKWRYGFGTKPGWVRCNGRSIGTSVSGATERANADAETLYNYLWNIDPNLVVTGGRGASGADDWAANKPIATPDLRGTSVFGMDDMGSGSAGRITAATIVTGSPFVLGSIGGVQQITLSAAEIPAHSHTGTTASSGDHIHTYDRPTSVNGVNFGNQTTAVANFSSSSTGSAGAHTHTFTTDSIGGGGAHNNMPPFMIGTFYIKL